MKEEPKPTSNLPSIRLAAHGSREANPLLLVYSPYATDPDTADFMPDEGGVLDHSDFNNGTMHLQLAYSTADIESVKDRDERGRKPHLSCRHLDLASRPMRCGPLWRVYATDLWCWRISCTMPWMSYHSAL